jgi:hypothetical protein
LKVKCSVAAVTHVIVNMKAAQILAFGGPEELKLVSNVPVPTFNENQVDPFLCLVVSTRFYFSC